MSDDSTDPRNLEICKQDTVFQHFPMQRLIENPGTWSTLKYKYGRLIVKDSNDVEWVYVIKSGEARVLKHLEPGTVDVQSRRKKIQQTLEEGSPFYRKKKILDFIADRDSVKSQYRIGHYYPGRRRTIMSAPPSYGHRNCLNDIGYRSLPGSPLRPGILRDHSAHHSLGDDQISVQNHERTLRLPRIKLKNTTTESDDEATEASADDKGRLGETYSGYVVSPGNESEKDEGVMLITADDIRAINENVGRRPHSYHPRQGILKRPRSEKENGHTGSERPQTEPPEGRAARYVHTPSEMSRTTSMARRSATISRTKSPPRQNTVLPSFVQIETLHPGQTFGLRACLDPDVRGPSVSLVSGECEVLAINKKFFMKHCDDALYSLIRLKAKPFPSQEELIDRLDANMQWDEFKKQTVREFLQHKISVR